LLNLRIGNEEILGQELEAVKERFKAGDVTSTDLKQSEARVARSKAEYVAASGQLENSRAEFERVVGFAPDDTLYIPAQPFDFPPGLEDMVKSAESGNPALETSRQEQAAAQKDVDQRFGELLPEVLAYATYNKQYDLQPGIVDDSETKTIGIRAKVPLYEAGTVRSKVREAKNIASQREQQVSQQRRLLREDIARNWNVLMSAREEIAARQVELEAAQAAREGVREESKMGERTVLDVLDADQDVLSAEAAKARAHRDEVVASYALAASLGWLLPEKMGMADIVYQPGPHYRAMQKKIVSMDNEK
jgi:TolC family type I secretion outer membrane protein